MSSSRVFSNAPRSSSGLRARLSPSIGVARGVLEVVASGDNGVEKMILALSSPESGEEDLDRRCWGLRGSSRLTIEEA